MEIVRPAPHQAGNLLLASENESYLSQFFVYAFWQASPEISTKTDFSVQSLQLVLLFKHQHKKRFISEYVSFPTFYWIFSIAFTSKLQCYLNGGQGQVLSQGYVQSYVYLQLRMTTRHKIRGVKRLRCQISTSWQNNRFA